MSCSLAFNFFLERSAIMETKILTKNQIKEAAKMIQAGQLVAFPTETVYGLGADAKCESAVKNVYVAKGRPSDNPLIVHVAEVSQIKEFVENIPENFFKLAENFWPGPLTMLLPIIPESLSKSVTGGLETCAFRMPDNSVTLNLINESGTVLVGPSANTSGKPSPTTAQHVYHDFKGKIAGILDDGPTRVGVESTVLDLSEPKKPVILRPGVVTKEDLEKILGIEVFIDGHLVKENEAPKAPGMKYTHYSPNAKVYMMKENDLSYWKKALESFPNEKVGLLADDKIVASFPDVPSYSLGSFSGKDFNHGLFAGLRALDEEVTVILAQTLPETGTGIAYMNRLKKSSGQTWF